MITCTTEDLRHFLAFWLQVMSASERLLLEAAIETDDLVLKQYYRDHQKEEENHALWLREDLEGEVLPVQSLATVIAGSQYYLIKHASPAALLGYLLALENPISLEELEELEAVHGKSLLRTIRIHVTEDPGHKAEVERMIALQDESTRRLIEWNRLQTLQYIQGYKR